MPIYEYACKEFGYSFEEMQLANEAPIKKCPQCGKNKVFKLISKSAFQLKGGGWYADGYVQSKSNDKPSPTPEPKPKAAETKPAAPKAKE